MQGGLSLFSMALPTKPEKLVLKNLPKSVNLSTVTKKNYQVSVKVLIKGIELLKKIAISENYSIRRSMMPTRQLSSEGQK